MNIKVKKVLKSLLITMILIVCTFSSAYATVSGLIGEPEPSAGELENIGSNLVGAVVGIAWIIATGMVIVIGIRYMMASANEKADLKNGAIRYVIGVLLLASLATIFSGIMSIMSGASGGGGAGSGGTSTSTPSGGTTGGTSGGTSDKEENNKKEKVAIPTLVGDIRYNGSNQQISLRNVDSNKMTVKYYEEDGVRTSTSDVTEAGERKVVKVSLKDTNKYTWSDGTTGTKTFNVEVKPMILKVEWQDTTTFTYDGTEKVPKVKVTKLTGANGDTIELAVSGGRINEGEYTAKAEMSKDTKSKDYAKNYVLDNDTIKFTITK